ncbi:DUF2653 family protein [Listeria fleischmannii]|uniref:Tim44-like domain-containing protein n=1 Tax=Listeria fleischmannii FSL S10-1203 TaxID=1265822 RepID=W7DUB5_9LIST|nr:DUF2653 family protein [Listeria fleischmannii]EUJ58933.1 hypothetical protein MCOL2_06727 [Listeria fleischmannii FSL S10-1203]
MKKLVSVLLAATLIVTPLGGTVINTIVPVESKYTQVKEADARGYRSPVRSFKSNNNGINRSNVNRSQTNTGAANTGKRGFFSGGGLLGGLMMGGIAGLLFGGLLSNMGALGNIFGLMINILAIILIIRLVMMLFTNRKKNQQAVMASNRGASTEARTETIQAATTSREEILDEGNISNAVIAFFTHEKGLTLDDVQVALTYDEKIGFGADVIQNDRIIQQLDHFSLVQAIRYWAEHFARMDPNIGLKLEYSEQDGIYAVITE